MPQGDTLPPTQRHIVYKHAGQCLRFLRKKSEVSRYFLDVEHTFQHLKGMLPEDKILQAFHLDKVVSAASKYQMLEIGRRDCVRSLGGEWDMDNCEKVLYTATIAYLKMRWKHHLNRALQRDLVPVGQTASAGESENREAETSKTAKVPAPRNKRSKMSKKFNFV